MENKTITMEFDFAPFKKAVTDILLNEVKNHVYASREDYTKSYDVRGFIHCGYIRNKIRLIFKKIINI